ncbi:MAG: hypothetical protein ACXVRE_04960 [Gaiellaceae bacterium]
MAAYAPLVLAAPWLITLVWVIARTGRSLWAGSEPQSMAEAARRRLTVR